MSIPQQVVAPVLAHVLSRAAWRGTRIILRQTSPEAAIVGHDKYGDEASTDKEMAAERPQTLQEALILAEARRLMEQLQRIGFSVSP